MAKKLVYLLDRCRRETSTAGQVPWRLLIFIEKLRLVDPIWRIGLAAKNRGRRSPRIGFGPIIERENTLGFRKWAVDPIVDAINRAEGDCVADIFFGDEDLSRFDVLVIVKNIETLTREAIDGLKAAGKVLIYNPRDNPAGCQEDYRKHPWFISAMDGFILSSPAQQAALDRQGLDYRVIGTPIINTRAKSVYRHGRVVELLWQGYRTNAGYMERLHPVIEQINSGGAVRVCLTYQCDRRPDRSGDPGVRFVQWRMARWEKMLVAADVGVVIKPADEPAQREKPPTKIVSYMAAGLPVICTPSAADRQVIEHGRTGFFAESDEEWRELLERLAMDAQLRERIGLAGREHVLSLFRVDRIAAEYLAYAEGLRRVVRGAG